MNTTYVTFRKKTGFTLIELLTVIAIIGILAAIIIPTVGRVRQTARESVNMSNLRQIGIAAQMFAGDNKEQFPYHSYSAALLGVHGSKEVGDSWADVLIPYIAQKRTGGYHRDVNRAVLRSPTAGLISPDDNGVRHYSMHGGIGNNTEALRIKKAAVKRPSQVILFCDGTQSEPAPRLNSRTNINRPNAVDYGYSGDLSQPVAEYTDAINVDAPAGAGYPRFRNGGNRILHAAMVDGSVKGFKLGEITYGNITANR